MKVTLVNKSDIRGGAAIACYRLFKALNQGGCKANLLVQQKITEDAGISTTTNTWIKRKWIFFQFVLEKMIFLFYEKSKEIRFSFSLANTGENISKRKVITDADIIHIHWINQAYLSLGSIKKLINLKKPVIITLHDMWSFTGGCHYAGSCDHFKVECGYCPYLINPHPKDISFRILKKKAKIFKDANITVVGCSQWMAELAKKSSLFKNTRVESISNPINTDIFKPSDKMDSRKIFGFPEDKLLILFGAANIFETRKGLRLLYIALEILKSRYPELIYKVELVLFGKANYPLTLPFTTHYVSYRNTEEELATLYNASDIFVLPSLEDNLPNTIMESLSCGTPVIAFNTGGIPEMIDHLSNGYLAQLESSEDLAEGIYWSLFKADREHLAQNARKKVLEKYSPQIIAEKYISLYKQILV